MAYVLRIYTGENLSEFELEPGRQYRIGGSQEAEIPMPGPDLLVTAGEDGWTAEQWSHRAKRHPQGAKRGWEEVQVLDEADRVALAVYRADFNAQRSLDLSGAEAVVVGRSSSCDIAVSDRQISGRHLELRRTGSGWSFRDLGSSNGTYRNGVRCAQGDLGEGDVLTAGFARLFLTGDTLHIAASGDVASHLRQSGGEEEPSEGTFTPFERSPRLKLEMPRGGLEIQAPPNVANKPEIHLLSTFLPAIGTIGLALVMTFAMGNTMMLLYSLPMTLIGLITSVAGYFRQKKKYSAQVAARLEMYTRHLEESAQLIERKQWEQRQAMLAADPDVNACFSMARRRDRRLWERRPGDEDFLSVRLGAGAVESSFQINIPKAALSLEEDELSRRPGELYRKYHLLADAPITCNILESQVCGIVGERQDRLALLRNMVAQIAAHHCYTEVKIIPVCAEADRERLGWMERLPHAWDNEKQTSFSATSKQGADEIFRAFADVMKSRERETGDSFGSAPFPLPYYLFVIAEPAFLGRNDPITEYLFHKRELNAGVIMAVDTVAQLPKECSLIIEVQKKRGEFYRRDNASLRRAFSLDDAREEFGPFAEELFHLVCDENVATQAIPKSYTFFEMLDVSSAGELDLGALWSRSRVTASMAVPLGIGEGGKQIALDLHEKAHGPHGLVAGTTGSGKSELLQSLILALAVHFSPREVGFVIIDFKGGGMANQFEKLPHMLGTITNIDGRAISRSLASIKAELTKRQRLFAQERVNSIDQYIEKYRSGAAPDPLPHLIIVVDEFAELKAEQPEFMKELISAARIGRSLGVHLILATQKPSGQVNDQIWSNSRFRICLKVATREDSQEMIKSPAAFAIKEPGRAYLQVGNNEVFELFQSGYSGGRTAGGATQLEAVVEQVARYCAEQGIGRLPSICLPPLPERIGYVPSPAPAGGDIRVCLGRYDSPADQSQGDVTVNLSQENVLIVGSPQYGKTNVLQGILRSGCERYSSDRLNFYIVDFASMLLKNFEASAHVGGVVLTTEEEKMENLFKLLLEEVGRRRALFARQGVSSFSAYLEAGFGPLPQIVLLIDNLTVMQELYPQQSEALLSLSREGISVGISAVVANPQVSGVGFKYLLNFPRRIGLYCNDSGEYNTLFDRSRLGVDSVPGRALVEVDHQVVEAQMFLSFEGEREIDRVREIRAFVERSNSVNSGLPARKIPQVPETVTLAGLEADGYDLTVRNCRIPLGVDYATMELFHLDLMKGGFLAIAGGEGRGKTNLTRHILRSIQDHIFDNLASLYIADDTGGLAAAEDYGCTAQFVRTAGEAKGMVEAAAELLRQRRDTWDGGEAERLPLILLVLSGRELTAALLQDSRTAENLLMIGKDMRRCKAFVLLSEVEDAPVNYASSPVLKQIKETHSMILLENIGDIRMADIPLKLQKEFARDIRVGDGYSLLGGKVRKIRFVLDQDDEGREEP